MPRPHPKPRTQALASSEPTAEERRLATEYAVDLDLAAAAVRAAVPPSTARRLFPTDRFQLALRREVLRRQTATQIYADDVLRCWEAARRVDYRRFSGLWHVPCRRCWGFEHQHQFKDHEFVEARAEHAATMMKRKEANRVPFDERGGPGYTINRAPCRGPDWAAFMDQRDPSRTHEASADHSCPACHGHGEPHPYFADTDTLTAAEAYVYQGVERGANGAIKYDLRPRADFDKMIGQHMGLLDREGRALEGATVDDIDAELERRGKKIQVVDVEFEELQHGAADRAEEAQAAGGEPAVE